MTPSTMDTGPAAAELKRKIADLVGAAPEQIGDDDNLAMLGVGSLEVMRLVTGWRRAGLAVDFSELIAQPTVREWAALLAAAWAGRDEAGQ